MTTPTFLGGLLLLAASTVAAPGFAPAQVQSQSQSQTQAPASTTADARLRDLYEPAARGRIAFGGKLVE